MPILSNPRYRNGDGENLWTVSQMELDILRRASTKTVLAATASWIDYERCNEIKNWVSSKKERSAVVIAMIDQLSGGADPEFPLNYGTDGIHIIHCLDYCFWLAVVDKHFVSYSKQDVTPTSFTNKFLCYQNKISTGRELLFEHLCEFSGLITLNNPAPELWEVPEYPEIEDSVPGPDNPTNRPNDILSLGNIDIWNQSFLNIVSETHQNFHSHKHYFISEKTFKPIIGMRPFLIFGPPALSEHLRKMGFETFEKEFDYNHQPSYQDQAPEFARVVEQLEKENLTALYQKLLPKIEHNRNHLSVAAAAEEDKLKYLIEKLHRGEG